MLKTILITGSCGFIATNFVQEFFRLNINKKYRLIGLDKLKANHNLANLFEHPEYKFYLADFSDLKLLDRIFSLEKIDLVIHAGAESFVDSSLESAQPFIYSNILGTQNIIDMCVKYKTELIYISTDEVYSQHVSVSDKPWKENFPPSPRNPYSASKYSGEILIKAAANTHGIKYKITRCCNNYGKYQYRLGNLIPKIISCNLQGNQIPLHNQGKAYREWINAKDHCSAIMCVLENGNDGEIYNVGSGLEFSNLEIVETISELMSVKPKLNLNCQRPGLDFRYSVDSSKIRSLGWSPKINFTEGITETIEWFSKNVKYV